MTDNIKLPPMPKPHTPPVFATAANTPSVKAGYELGGYEKTPPLFDEHQLEAFAREAVRLNATVPDGDAAEDVHDTNAVLASRYFELLKVVEAYEKHGVTCQTFRHFVDTPCAECNCAPAAPQPAQQPLTDEHKAILKECRNQAMKWTVEARIPEAGAFGGIAQDLDYLCGRLEVKND